MLTIFLTRIVTESTQKWLVRHRCYSRLSCEPLSSTLQSQQRFLNDQLRARLEQIAAEKAALERKTIKETRAQSLREGGNRMGEWKEERMEKRSLVAEYDLVMSHTRR